MGEKEKDFGDEALEKLKEIGWFVAVSILRWLLGRIVGGDPDRGDGDAETKH